MSSTSICHSAECDGICRGRSLIQTLKSTGHKVDLCGTPYLTVPSDEQEPWMKTRCTLFLRYEPKKGS